MTSVTERPPRVFISHASEDRARFVEPFARALRAKRIDAWVSSWEMQTGDSLPRKVFEEAIGGADVVVIVVSAISVTKPWVIAELETATVRRIAGTVRVMPVVLEHAPVPVQLESLIWATIPVVDTAGIDMAANAVIRAVYAQSERPPLGGAPAYIDALGDAAFRAILNGGTVPSAITQVDLLVLREAGQFALLPWSPGENPLEFGPFNAHMQTYELDVAAVGEALLMLERADLIQGAHALGHAYPLQFSMTTVGMELVIGALVPNYDAICRRIAAAVVNGDERRSDTLARSLGVAEPVVEHVIRLWGERKWALISNELHGEQVVVVYPPLRRWLRG